jgi:mono/diheme cytochrome c family protein
MLATPLLAFAVLLVQAHADSGATLYKKSCANCHGADGHGPPASTHLDVRPPDLASCKYATAEHEAAWVGTVRDGGAARGLSSIMPAFKGTLTPEQIEAVVHYVRSLCKETGWPPGDLNFPRATLSEKAFPEDEVVITTHGSTQEYIYERRIGKRGQIEAVARTTFDSLDDPFNGVTAAFKYNLWHSAAKRSLVSAGLEVTPPVGRQDEWELEPFLAAGTGALGWGFLQGEVGAEWEDEGIEEFFYTVGFGRTIGRFTPILELGGAKPEDGENELSLVPQVLIQLSRLGHVAASIGVDVPIAGPSRDARLTAFILWDFADGGLFRGW